MRWIILPVLVLAAVHATWTLYLRWVFETRIDELRAAGAPVCFADLVPPPIPDDDNAAPLLAEADRWYEQHLLPGESVERTYHWGFLEFDAGDSAEMEKDLAALRKWLARGGPYVELLARAAARPKLRQDLDWEAGHAMLVPAGPQVRRAAVFLGNRVRRAESATPDRLRELAVLLDLAGKVERHLVIQVLARWATENHAAEALEVLARKPGFDAQMAREVLDGRFAATDDASLLSDALRGERASGLSFSRRWIRGESPIRMLRDLEALTDPDASDKRTDSDDWLSSDAFLGSWLVRPLAYRDGLRLLDLMERALALLDGSPNEAASAAEALEKEYRRSLPNIASHLYAVVPTRAMEDRLRHLANMRIARVGLALMELRQKTGAWPQTLDAVVSMVGPDTVIDPFTGERLHYEPGARVEAAAPIPEEYRELSPEDLRDLGYEVAWRFQRT